MNEIYRIAEEESWDDEQLLSFILEWIDFNLTRNDREELIEFLDSKREDDYSVYEDDNVPIY